jgi:hypothetical protein
VLEQVSRQLRISVVSEEFTRSFPAAAALRQRGEISGSTEEILDRLCEIFGYQWRLVDGVYQVRGQDWDVDRAQEPPGTLVKAVRVARQERRALSLDWLAAAALVAPARQPRLWLHAPSAQFAIARAGAAIRFYALLPPEQRAALQQEPGLPYASLAPQAQQALAAAARASLRQPPPDWSPAALAPARVRLVQGPAAARLILDNTEPRIEIEIPLPAAGAVP